MIIRTGIIPLMIIETDDGMCYIKDHRGYYVEAEQMNEIGKKLIKTAKAAGVRDSIIECNIKTKQEIENEIMNCGRHPQKDNKPKSKGYIYLMECNGKYKIGVSKNVEKRRRQLSINSPFQIKIVATSPLIEDVYKEEQALHQYYGNYIIKGEWFDLPEREVLDLIIFLEQYEEISENL